MTTFLERGLALVENGYRIIPIPARTKAPKLDEWEQIVATPDMVRKWSARGYLEGSIGILTARTPAVDLDILDAALCNEMTHVVARVVGSPLPLLARVGRAPKRLLLFSTTEPFTKVASSFFIDPAGVKHRVEVLGEGQQFVAYGIHEDTLKPYEWVSLDSPLTSPVDELPNITRDQARKIAAAFEERAAARGWKRVALAFKGSFDEAGTGSASDTGIDMRPKLHVSSDEIKAALELMEGHEDYETWFRVGMGLHHQFGGNEEGFELWDQWSQKAINYDLDALRYRWDESFKESKDGGHGPITCAFIIKNANDKKRALEEQAFIDLQAEVDNCLDFKTLMGAIGKKIAEADLSTVQRSVLTKLMQKMAKKFTGVTVSLKDMQSVTKPRSPDGDRPRSGEELEVSLAKRVLRTRFEDGAHLKRFGKMSWGYVDGFWRRMDDEFIERCVLETLTDLRRINDKTLRDLIGAMDESRGDRLNALVSTVTSVMMKLVAEDGSTDPLNLNAFDAPRVVNCLNLEVWVDDEGDVTTQDHNPVHNLTSQLACEYDPDAKCPTWDRAIRKVFKKCDDPEEVIRHFYEVFGYIMQPTRDVAIWILFKGPGGNGKSFLLRILTELMGRGTVIGKSISEIATGTTSHFTTSLIGKLMLLDDDLKTHTLLPDDWLKKLSEAKLLSADPKFASGFEFIARAIPVILTNPWPATSDLSEGMRRRAKVFEATHILTDDEKDPAHVREIRLNEFPGILNHLIAGLQRLLKRNTQFREPPECIGAKDRWLASSNTTMRFVKECVEIVPDRKSSIRASELYDHYSAWLRYFEISAKPLGRNKFYEAMDAVGLKRVNHSNVTYYSHVKVRLLENAFEDLDPDDGLEDDGLVEVDDGLLVTPF